MQTNPQAVLPHRYPFLLVDRLIAFEDDAFHAIKNVTFNEPFFQGHFPQEPVMPGVLIVEALAQAAGMAVAAKGVASEGAVGYLTGIDGAKIRRKVEPGDVLDLTGRIVTFRRNLCKVEAAAHVAGELAAEAQLSFMYSG